MRKKFLVQLFHINHVIAKYPLVNQTSLKLCFIQMLARYTIARYNNTIATIIALIGFIYSIEIKSNRHGIADIAQQFCIWL